MSLGLGLGVGVGVAVVSMVAVTATVVGMIGRVTMSVVVRCFELGFYK